MIHYEQLLKIINECRKHIVRLEEAYGDMTKFVPLNQEAYAKLSRGQVRIIDQYLFRFGKLQDAIGKKLFKSILIYLGEDIEDKSFIDMLNRLEKLNLLSDSEGWFELRQIRNELAHEYEDDNEEMGQIINKIFNEKARLVSYFTLIEKYFINSIQKH